MKNPAADQARIRRFLGFFSILGLVFFLTLPGLSLFGEVVAPFVMPSARFSGLGGNHVAQGDDFYSQIGRAHV
jgi:hypothetical protein